MNTREQLTDEQCNEFRRRPLTFNGMVKDIYEAGFEAGKAASDADAERYRWILDNYVGLGGGHGIKCSFFVPVDHEDLGCAIDQAIIDAAMKVEKP